METEETTPGAERTGILVVVVFTAIRAVLIAVGLLISAGIVTDDRLSDISPLPLFPLGTPAGLLTSGALATMMIVSVLCIWGLIRRREWGWTLSIVTAGTILALSLGWWASGQPHYVSMAVNSVMVFYLNQRDLRLAFGVGKE